MAAADPPLDGASMNRLTSLPTELLTKVLEVLSVRDICDVRLVSRGLRDFVDTNEKAIARHTVASNCQRLRTRISWLVDLQGLDLIDVLNRYTSYYGNIEIESATERNIVISAMAVESLKQQFVGLSEAAKSAITFTLLDFFTYFTRCHWYMHNQSHLLATRDEEMETVMMHTWAQTEISAAQLGAPTNDIEYLRARVQDGSLMRGPQYTRLHGLPEYPITARYGLARVGDAVYSNNCDQLLLGRTLGLPSPSEGLGYCVKSERMQKMVHDACTASEPLKSQLFWSDLPLAALMEELFVF